VGHPYESRPGAAPTPRHGSGHWQSVVDPAVAGRPKAPAGRRKGGMLRSGIIIQAPLGTEEGQGQEQEQQQPLGSRGGDSEGRQAGEGPVRATERIRVRAGSTRSGGGGGRICRPAAASSDTRACVAGRGRLGRTRTAGLESILLRCGRLAISRMDADRLSTGGPVSARS
jgi:hypothetical protein